MYCSVLQLATWLKGLTYVMSAYKIIPTLDDKEGLGTGSICFLIYAQPKIDLSYWLIKDWLLSPL